MEITSHSESDTRVIAQSMAARLTGGDVVLLFGELGAGKTTFTKALARAIGVAEDVTSPTFALMNMYQVSGSMNGISHFVHIDTYRLKDENELLDIGAQDYIGDPDAITVIEWPEKILKLLQNKKTINVSIVHGGGNERIITAGALNDDPFAKNSIS